MNVLTVSGIVESHRNGLVTPSETVRHCYERIRLLDDPGIFISLRDKNEVLAEAHSLNDTGDLYGVPVAIKDNIDVAGMPTTVLLLHIRPKRMPKRSRSSSVLARSSSERPISINSRPVSSDCARPTRHRAMRSAAISFRAAPAPARRLQLRLASRHSRSAPTRRARAGCQPCSTISWV